MMVFLMDKALPGQHAVYEEDEMVQLAKQHPPCSEATTITLMGPTAVLLILLYSSYYYRV